MGIKTDVFISELVRSFYERLTTNDVYFAGSDYNLSSNTINSNFAIKDVLERSIFGQKIQPSDISYMIYRNIWAPNIVYSIYDDEASLSSANFYVITEPENPDGDYHVWKCLFNNNGGASTAKPIWNEDIIELGGESSLSDGYVWKYMFSVSSSIAAKFQTITTFPIVENGEVANTATTGIDTILVTNYQTNYGYKRVAGFSKTEPTPAGRIEISANTNTPFNTGPNIYQEGVAYFFGKEDDAGIDAAQFTIKTSGVESGVTYIEIDMNEYAASEYVIEKDDRIEILPKVKITGTGSGATAIPIFDSTNTRINAIKMLSRGTGYTAAAATVIQPSALNLNAGDVEATLRPIIPPAHGHGYDPVKELRSDSICLSTVIKAQLGSEIPDTGEYAKMVLLYEPTFVTRNSDGSANTVTTSSNTYFNAVTLEAQGGSLPEPGTTVFQPNGASGVVHHTDGNDIYVINFALGNSVKFTDELPLGIGDTSINIVDVTYPSYLERSGEVLYVTDFLPIERTDTKEELVKILIDF